jgi:hypothetical protein
MAIMREGEPSGRAVGRLGSHWENVDAALLLQQPFGSP